MGKLQDKLFAAKYGLTSGAQQIAVGALKIPLNIASAKMQRAMAKEDPAKVRAFLEDVANEPTLPQSVRDSRRAVLEEFTAGKDIGAAMNEQTTGQIRQLEKDLIDGSDGK